MPGTVKIWWHDGVTRDVRYSTVPLINEPELGFETLSLNGTAIATRSAPTNATVAVVETDVNVRYLVRRPGTLAPADPARSKPLAVTGMTPEVIGVVPGGTISFIDV